jgi:vacuolar-type H+-ATPase subunit H
MNKTKINKNKQKRLFKKTKKNRKYYGGKIAIEDNNYIKKYDKGKVNSLQDKISSVVSAAGKYIGDKGLRLVGLERIEDSKKQEDDTQETKAVKLGEKETTDVIDSEPSNLKSNVESIGDDIVNVVNKTSGSVIENVNEVLGSPELNIGIADALENTKDIIQDNMNIINDITNDPKFEKTAEKTLDNVAKYSEIAVKALDEPLNNAIDELNEAGSKAASGVVTSGVNILKDAASAVPFAGSLVAAGNIVNDVSKATSSIVEAGSTAATTLSELVKETSENIDESLEELNEKKNEATNIVNRTSKSIEDFTTPTINPVSSIIKKVNKDNKDIKGGTRKQTKYKSVTKRVRFAL